MLSHFEKLIDITSNNYINGSELLGGEYGLKQCLTPLGIINLDLFELSNLDKLIISIDAEKSKIKKVEHDIKGTIFKKSVLDILAFTVIIEKDDVPGLKKGKYHISNLYDILRIPLIGQIKNFNKEDEEDEENKSLNFVFKLSMLIDESLYQYYYKINKIINNFIKCAFRANTIKNDNGNDFFIVEDINFEESTKEDQKKCANSGGKLISLALNDFTLNGSAQYQEKHWLFYKNQSKDDANADQEEVLKTLDKPNSIYVTFQLKLTDIAKKWDNKEKAFIWIDKTKQESNFLYNNSISFIDRELNQTYKSKMNKRELNELFKSGSTMCTFITPLFSISQKFGLSTRLYDTSSGYNKMLKKNICTNNLFETTSDNTTEELMLMNSQIMQMKNKALEEEKEKEKENSSE